MPLKGVRSAGGERLLPANCVLPFTHSVHQQVRPWSPRSQGFPRESDATRTEGPRRLAAPSSVAPRRRRCTKSSPRTSRAGSHGGKPRNGPCRDTSKTNSVAISPEGSSASASPAPGPPTDWGELVQVHDDRDIFEASALGAARDRHPQPLTAAASQVTTKPPVSEPPYAVA